MIIKGVMRQRGAGINCSLSDNGRYFNLDLDNTLGYFILEFYRFIISNRTMAKIGGADYLVQNSTWNGNNYRSIRANILGIDFQFRKYEKNPDGSLSSSDKVSITMTLPEKESEVIDGSAENPF